MYWQDKIKDNCPNSLLADKVIQAIQELFKHDAHLFEVNSSERSITHQMAIYLISQFPDYNIDCEYNRDHYVPKTLRLPRSCTRSQSTDGSYVYPDIIVHIRGTPKNYLVIEIKKSTSNVCYTCDLKKLEAYINELKYDYGLFIRFYCNQSPDIQNVQWFVENA